MTFKSNLFCCFFLLTLLGFPTHVQAQKLDSKKLDHQFKQLLYQKKYDSVLALSKKYLQPLKVANSKDSLFRTKLEFFEHNALQYKEEPFDRLASLERLIRSCPQSESGDSLKAVLYNHKAYFEAESVSTMMSLKSISASIKLLEGLSNPNPGYLMGAYLLMSSNHAFFGNFEQARRSMRLAEDVYAKNKQTIDQNTQELNGNNHRLGVIAKYRKTYMLWKLSSDSKDSLTLLETMNALEQMHNQPNFHQDERIYYSTALNHTGDWLASHKPDSLVTEKDLEMGLSFLLKSLYFIEKKNYPGTPWALRYNIAKAFTKGNQLEKADSTMSILFRGISPTDGRLSFFYAQKALIKAKKQEKDSALLYFHQSIEKIHQGEEKLSQDYRNFKPSKRYNHTRLLLRIQEELERFYKKDSSLQKNIAFIPYMALQQFENSYLDANFNSKQNSELRRIIQGILRSKRTGYLNEILPQKTLLNQFETFKNQLAWKRFYENRYTNSLPELDSVKQRQVKLSSLLTKAKVAQNMTQQDSIQRLLENHRLYKKERFPQLDLLSNFEFSVETLQSELDKNELILKYILLEDQLAVYQISSSEISIETLPWNEKEKQQLIRFIENSRNRNDNTEVRNNLTQLLIPNIDNKITRLIINPDGILFKLPFETLGTDNRLLIEDYSIRYTSNLGFVTFRSEHNTASENIHVYAPHYTEDNTSAKVRQNASFLQGASNEAKTISSLFPSLLFNDASLTKSEFIKTAGKAKLLHLAMHAEVNENFPEFSRLLFCKNVDKEEEHLYLEELYGLSLSAELAILSACNTGTGLEKNGHLESFQRAFTFAGVPATVASLWEVPDTSTEEIMVLFYQNLKEGQTKSEALRHAKLTYKENHAGSKLSDPYFWAGFVVYGSDTPIAEKPFSPFTFVLIAMIATPILWYRRRKSKRQSAA